MKWKDDPDLKNKLETVLHTDDHNHASGNGYFAGESSEPTTQTHEATPTKKLVIKKGQHIPALGVDPGVFKTLKEGEVPPAMQNAPDIKFAAKTVEKSDTHNRHLGTHGWNELHGDLVDGMSCKEAAKKYGKHVSTIYSHYNYGPRKPFYPVLGAIRNGYLVLNDADKKLKVERAGIRDTLNAANRARDKENMAKVHFGSLPLGEPAAHGPEITPQTKHVSVHILKSPEDMTVRELKQQIETQLANVNRYAALLNLKYGLLS